MISKSAILSALVFGFVFQTSAAIIGTNVPASPLTAQRIAALPAEQQRAWKNYLDRSARQMQADRDFLRAEMKAHKIKHVTVPPAARSTEGVALDKPEDWYAGAEAGRIANIIVSFQTPAGGWSKNLDMTRSPREPGENFAADKVVKVFLECSHTCSEIPSITACSPTKANCIKEHMRR
jgi:hypothetical protein